MTGAAGPAELPRVAVIIPSFNDVEWIEGAIASLAGQEEVELVVVDDGSTDADARRVFDRLSERGVRVIHQDNAGLAGARMAGVEATSAPFILPLDADDEVAPGAIAALADALDRHPELGVVWGDVEPCGSTRPRRAVKGSVLCPWRITFMNELVGAGGVMIRRSALEAVGGWTLPSGYEDWDMWLAFAEHGIAGRRIDRICLRYRIQPGRMNATLTKSFDVHYAQLRARHPLLWERRDLNRASAHASRPLIAAWTAIEGSRWLPARWRTRLMLATLWACEPWRITRPLRRR